MGWSHGVLFPCCGYSFPRLDTELDNSVVLVRVDPIQWLYMFPYINNWNRLRDLIEGAVAGIEYQIIAHEQEMESVSDL